MQKVIDCPEDFKQRVQPRLVFGDLHQALLSAEYKKERSEVHHIGSVSGVALQAYLTCVVHKKTGPRLLVRSGVNITLESSWRKT